MLGNTNRNTNLEKKYFKVKTMKETMISLMNSNLILNLNSMTHIKETKIDIWLGKHINLKHVGLAYKN